MTTFTEIGENDQPEISVYPSRRLSKINNNIYGGFTEHLGRCIYGGLYDPGNSNKHLVDEHGFRKDVIEAMQELNCPVVRYPGGNFCATYHWLDGVGPVKDRPRRPELAWLGLESNEFGTDEFMKWCEVVGTEPYLCLNFGTGTLDEALAWLEYCNSSKDTYYANMRRKNGHEKPYNVKYWAVGNECYGPWQVEQMTKEDYAKKAYQWAKAMKLLDPSITLVLCGETGTSQWDHHVLSECLKVESHALGGTGALFDMHSIHAYTTSNDHVKNAFSPRSAERAIEVCASLIDMARIVNNVPSSIPRQTLCVDEWNVWDPQRAPGETGAEELYTLSDALAVAIWLNVFIRQSKYVGMANIAQSVNVISPLMTTQDGVIKQTTWWPLLLFSKYMRGWTVATHTSTSCYQGDTKPDWMRSVDKTPWLDVSATVSDDGWNNLVVVNVHPDKSFKMDVDGLRAENGEVEVYTVTGDSWDVVNTADKQGVELKQTSWTGEGTFDFPRMSMTMLRSRSS